MKKNKGVELNFDDFIQLDDSNEYNDRAEAANKALENGDFQEAWDLFLSLYSLKDAPGKKYKEYRGIGAMGLWHVMQDIPNDHKLIEHIIETDTELNRKSKVKHITGDFARKFIGRKYLIYAADVCGNYEAIREYALNCVGSGRQKSFVFDYNDRDAKIGLQWANMLLNTKSKENRVIGYIVYAKYHFAKYTALKQKEDAKLFGDNVIKARNEIDENTNEYVMYFFAHLCANPNFKDYADGKYSDIKNGYKLFCNVVDYAVDPDLVVSARNIKTMLETKYPTKIS